MSDIKPDHHGAPRPSPAEAELIVESLELAGERCGDLTPHVYRRLFREQPQMEALFGNDRRDQVKGEMLARVIQAILDFLGEQHYAANLIRTEVINHAGFQVPPSVFSTFFETVAATLADLLGEEWTPEMDAAWKGLVDDLTAFAALPAQTA